MRWMFISSALAVLVLFLLTGCEGKIQPDNAQVERGKAIYTEFCQQCHGEAATGENSVGGAPVHGPDGHTWHHADGLLTDLILGQLDYPGRTMPSFQGTLSMEEVTAILAFLKTNWLSEQLAFQAEASRNWEELQ